MCTEINVMWVGPCTALEVVKYSSVKNITVLYSYVQCIALKIVEYCLYIVVKQGTVFTLPFAMYCILAVCKVEYSTLQYSVDVQNSAV